MSAIVLGILAMPAVAVNPPAGDYSKDNAMYVRLMTWNVLGQFPDGTVEQTAAFTRILTAINPDIVCLQEVNTDLSQTVIEEGLEALLGGSWTANPGQSDGFNKNVLATRFGLVDVRDDTVPASSLRGVTMGRVRLAATPDYDFDMFVMTVHFRASAGVDNDADRQRHADAIAAFMGDLKTDGGTRTVAPNTPIVIAGDFNIASTFAQQPYITLLTGDIQDEATFGPDVKGDWDDSDIRDVWPMNDDTFDFDTWQVGLDPAQRLDRILYTDSVVRVAQSFILNTRTMTPAQRAAAGLEEFDNSFSDSSDHLPLVVDFVVAPVAATEPLEGDVFVTEFIANPNGTDSDREWFELFNRGESAADVNGWRLRDNGSNSHRIDNGGPLFVPAKGYLVIGLNADMGVNGGAPVNYAQGGIFLNNASGDEIELYRGSVKVDGIRYNGGTAGFPPDNVEWGSQLDGSSRIMIGNYQNGRTGMFANSTVPYGVGGNGSPGAANEGAEGGDESWDLFMIY